MGALRVVMLLHKSVVHDSRVRREAVDARAAGHDVTVLELARRRAGARWTASPRAPRCRRAGLRRLRRSSAYRVAFLASFVARGRACGPTSSTPTTRRCCCRALLGARLTRGALVYDSHELATGVPYRDGGWARFVHARAHRACRAAPPSSRSPTGSPTGCASATACARARSCCATSPTLAPPAGADRPPARAAGLGDGPLVLHQGAAGARSAAARRSVARGRRGSRTRTSCSSARGEAGYDARARARWPREAGVARPGALPAERAARGAAGAHGRGRRRRVAARGHLREPPARAAEQGLRVHRRRRSRGRQRPARADAGRARSATSAGRSTRARRRLSPRGWRAALAPRRPALREHARAGGAELRWSLERERLLALYDALTPRRAR